MGQITENSKIINFCKNFNENLILFFYNSSTYKTFIGVNKFFKNRLLKNKRSSIFVRVVGKITSEVNLGDIGLFIILVVIFNTLAMVVFGREVDIFSIGARIAFFILGAILYVRNMRIR